MPEGNKVGMEGGREGGREGGNGGLMRFMLDESHQKEVIITSCQFCLYLFSLQLPTHSVTAAHAQTVQPC